ncbi:MAG: hypothetical protein LH472_08085 [Pyrinomonadaceae bacterium]|nr:hypothetical protein [Pyrinomonadaceae bacterium]
MNTQQIISKARTMPLADLEELVDEVLTIQAERRAPRLSGEESKLMKTIQRRLAESKQVRLRELQTLRDEEKLSVEGYAELAAITDELEEIHADRMKALLETANLRGITMTELMKQIGLNLPDYE